MSKPVNLMHWLMHVDCQHAAEVIGKILVLWRDQLLRVALLNKGVVVARGVLQSVADSSEICFPFRPFDILPNHR